MRRTLIAVSLVIGLAIPVCAQRWGGSARGGSFARSQPAVRGGGFRSQPGYPAREPRFQSGARIRGGIAFGHNPRWIISTSRPYWSFRRHRMPYASSFVYPYFFSPYYLSGFNDMSDSYGAYPYPYVSYAPVMTVPEAYVVSTPQPYYPYFPNQQIGLDTQMREQQVGIYRPPIQPETTTAPQQSAPAEVIPPAEQPLTALVYRDGRHVDVRNYAVVGQTLWIFNEQRAQKVPIVSIDIDATKEANAERGIEFALPASH